MRATRGAFLTATGAAGASFALLRRPADAAEFSFKMGLDQPASHPTSVYSVQAVEAIQRDSGGRIAIQVFMDNTLGNDTAMLTQVRSGAITFFNCPGSILANGDAMKSLPADLRDLVNRTFDAAGLRQRVAFAAANGMLEATLKAQGLVPNHPELTPFRAAVRQAGLYARWREQFGSKAWSLLEASSGTLG